MVADMNVTGINQAPSAPMDNVVQKEDSAENMAFTEALERKETENTEKENPKLVEEKPQKEAQVNTEEKKVEAKNQETNPSPSPNPITTKPNKSTSESELTKALKEKGDQTGIQMEAKDGSAIQKGRALVGVQGDSEILIQEDSKDVKKTKSDTKDLKKEDIKTLTDIKKQAQARNLNLQKIEVTQQGKNTSIDPKDLIDRSLLESNKERLAFSLQDKGSGLATNLKTETQSEISKREALLAELLNRYDAAENAKRRSQNASEKLQFKVGDGDKSMVIERGQIQPKNIIESKFRNDNIRQEFLEKLHGITGDDDLSSLIETRKIKLQSQDTIIKGKGASAIKPGHGVVQGQILDVKELKNTTLDMQVEKPFDSLFAENLKVDSKAKETELVGAVLKSEKKDEKPKEGGIEAKQEAGAIHTKQEVSIKNAIARETMRNFANQLREEILNYKPPITKINLELNPTNLGQVSMTIAKKGKDLQVSITSNANVMTMFVQNAQELRQNLMQIGFNNLDLNFGTHDGGNSESKKDTQEDDKKDNKLKIQSAEEAEAQVQLGNIPQSLEISLPEYA